MPMSVQLQELQLRVNRLRCLGAQQARPPKPRCSERFAGAVDRMCGQLIRPAATAYSGRPSNVS
jgi:hypothetical protein